MEMKNQGANSSGCRQWVLFRKCSIFCTYCSWAGAATHFSFKGKKEKTKSAGAVLSWESTVLHPSHASFSPACLPQSRALLEGCPVALSPWPKRVPSQPGPSCTEPRLSQEAAPTVVPECTLPATFLSCPGSGLPRLKLLFFIRQTLPVMSFNTKLFKPLSLL